MIQQWLCEACGGNGAVTLLPRADLWQGIAAVRAGHASASPACRAALTGHDIRVRGPQLTDQQWEQRCQFAAAQAEQRRAGALESKCRS